MRTRIAAAIVVAGLALTGCSGTSTPATTTPTTPAPSAPAPTSTDADAPVERADADLVIWTDDKRAAALQDVTAAFGEANGVTVAVQAVSTNLDTNFITADAAGNGPDIVIRGDDKIASFVQNGAIDPVQLSDADKAKFLPLTMKAVTYAGQTYGVPYAAESLVLLRNTAIAADAPSTFEELVATGQAAVEAGDAELPLSIQVGDTGDAFHLQALYASAGGYIFPETSEGVWDTTDLGVGKEGSLEFAKRISELGEKGSGVLSRSINSSNSISLFAEGKSPFLISGSWSLADVRTAGIDYAISPIPGFEDAAPATPWLSVQTFYVAAHGTNKALAQEFVRNTVGSEQAQADLYRAEPRPPALLSVLEKVSAEDADTKALAAAAEGGIPRPKIPQINAVWEPLNNAQAAIIGGADPVETMTAAGKAITAALD